MTFLAQPSIFSEQRNMSNSNKSETDSLKCHLSSIKGTKLYTYWQKKHYNQNCFIQVVISSNYVEINQ